MQIQRVDISSSSVTSKNIVKCDKPEYFWYEHPLTNYHNRNITIKYIRKYLLVDQPFAFDLHGLFY